ncbi:hypothetical protein ABMB68_009068 [Bradyrhizobium sp. RT4a]
MALEAALTELFVGPDEGLSFVIVGFDIGIDVPLELFEACEGSTAERLPLQDRETNLDLTEPGRACRREMKVHIGVGLEPAVVLLMGVEIVEDDVKLAVRKTEVTLSMKSRNSTRRRCFECVAMIFPVASSSAADSVVVPCRL